MTTARFTTAGGPVHRRNPAQCHGSSPEGLNQVWSWDIIYLPTSVRGVGL